MGGGVDRPNVSYIETEKYVAYNPVLTSNIITYKTSDNSTWLFADNQAILDKNGKPCILFQNTYNGNTGKLEFNSDIASLSITAIFDGEKQTLTDILLPDGISKIEQGAFYYCPNLQSISIPKSVQAIQGGVVLLCPNINNVEIDPENSSYYFDNGCIMAKSTKELIYGINSCIIPNDAKKIGGFAFSGSSIETITLPDSLLSIGENAFSSCKSLTAITIPNSVTSIGKEAFNQCSQLSSMVLPDSVITLGESCFAYMTILKSLTFGNKIKKIPKSCFSHSAQLKSLSLPSTIEKIDDYAFYYCNLKTLTINAINPPSLGTGVFDYGNDNIVISVPSESVDKYKTADGWKDYADNIQAIA